MSDFAAHLLAGFKESKRLSVGIDPHDELLNDWGLPLDASGAERFGREIVAQAADSALCVKPQIAFFERFGAGGFTALERIFDDAKAAGLKIIADVKRGDIGSTFDAYASSWLASGSPLETDAMTVHAYQGFGTLQGALDLAMANGKVVFVLAATSNPEAREVQEARLRSGKTVANYILENALDFNSANKVSRVGVVLGATLNLDDFEIDTTIVPEQTLPILAPGFGFQGAQISGAATSFGALSSGLIVHESRSILRGGPKNLGHRIAVHSTEIAAAIGDLK